MKFFICAGSGKSGTTSLYHMLKSHPEICMANKKEDNYFINSNTPSLKEYTSKYFPHYDKDKHKILGSVSPAYLFYPEAKQKIFNLLGSDTKIFFVLRNPIDFAYSHYWMSYRRGIELLSFEDALKEENKRLQKGDYYLKHFGYKCKGMYYKHLKEFYDLFPTQRIKIFIYEEVIRDASNVMMHLFNYLNVNNINYNIENIEKNIGYLPKYEFLRKIHGQPLKIKRLFKFIIPCRNIRWKFYPIIEKFNRSNKKYPPMRISTKKYLLDLFYDDIKKLEELAKLDLSEWYKEINVNKR